jgi:hypothetical protein
MGDCLGRPVPQRERRNTVGICRAPAVGIAAESHAVHCRLLRCWTGRAAERLLVPEEPAGGRPSQRLRLWRPTFAFGLPGVGIEPTRPLAGPRISVTSERRLISSLLPT